jgi:hypothetical protein
MKKYLIILLLILPTIAYGQSISTSIGTSITGETNKFLSIDVCAVNSNNYLFKLGYDRHIGTNHFTTDSTVIMNTINIGFGQKTKDVFMIFYIGISDRVWIDNPYSNTRFTYNIGGECGAILIDKLTISLYISKNTGIGIKMGIYF